MKRAYRLTVKRRESKTSVLFLNSKQEMSHELLGLLNAMDEPWDTVLSVEVEPCRLPLGDDIEDDPLYMESEPCSA